MPSLRRATIIYSDTQLVAELLGHTVVCLVELVEHARRGEPFPLLYESGCKYQREPPGSEVWQTPRASMASKCLDCEDAACWRSAELWRLGETRASPYVKRINPRLRHIVVERADGSIEDPSVILGMHKRSNPGEAAEALRAVLPPMRTPDAIPFVPERWQP
jgi:hypothetical protein